jgi:type IX secretion system PorP/SprF family membrane protein
MNRNRLRLLIPALLFAVGLFAQDIHFTQYNMSPMTLNPGLIGGFEGTARVGGIYRNQWSSVIRNEYVTPSFWVDVPVIRGFRKRDWVGAGVMFLQDDAGAVAFSQNAVRFGASYHLGLDKKGNTYLTLGGQGGQSQRSIKSDRFRFEDAYLQNPNGLPANSSDPFASAQQAKSFDMDGGIHLRTRLNKRTEVQFGYAMFHILRPKLSFTAGDERGRVPRRSVLHGGFNMEMNDRWTFSPTFLFQTMSGNDEIIVQGLGTYMFNKEKDIAFDMGLGYRLGDALHAIGGVRWKSLRVGLAYDINTSDLSNVSRNQGGFELAANYIIKIYKPASQDPQILCPRF